ncbi:trans-aconitate 2-methyltransferase [Frondihabitans sucicola]|uniref:Trans-aconitate 2-methyltransferase n=1 Tax=Frondihabitans sucicola TaxID=1268041 RepID=A0ABN6Y1N4_9MICO|nr:methyltransferase domain-containing protein [Frondihabitans sucicola]BDZ51262.1 trans-aconitate 2-methyltransferase [Frondihabitans sucicola]
MRWSPSQYDLFASHRATPFFDLVSRVQADSPRRVVDLGCGPGSLTATLAERWPVAEVVGIDSSADMIEAARREAARPDAGQRDAGQPDADRSDVGQDPAGRLRFELGDIVGWSPSPTDDVVVTNAALQWVPEHRALLPGWFDALPDGGWFAMQVPGSAVLPSHVILRELALSAAWAPLLSDVLRPAETVADAGDYLVDMLEAGLEAQAWETTYQQLLPGADPVLEWVRGTALRPVLAALSTDDSAAFEAQYASRLREAYPATRFGTVYPFRRVFAVGHKPAAR